MTLSPPRDNGGRFSEYQLDEASTVDLMAPPDPALALRAVNARDEAQRNGIPVSRQELPKDVPVTVVDHLGDGVATAVKDLVPGQRIQVVNGTATYLGVVEDRGDKALFELVKDPLECTVCLQESYSTEFDTRTCMSCRSQYGWTNPVTSAVWDD